MVQFAFTHILFAFYLHLQAIKTVKTAEFMPYVVFIASPEVEIQRNMYEWARMQRKTEKFKTVSQLPDSSPHYHLPLRLSTLSH